MRHGCFGRAASVPSPDRTDDSPSPCVRRSLAPEFRVHIDDVIEPGVVLSTPVDIIPETQLHSEVHQVDLSNRVFRNAERFESPKPNNVTTFYPHITFKRKRNESIRSVGDDWLAAIGPSTGQLEFKSNSIPPRSVKPTPRTPPEQKLRPLPRNARRDVEKKENTPYERESASGTTGSLPGYPRCIFLCLVVRNFSAATALMIRKCLLLAFPQRLFAVAAREIKKGS
ncbi:hypothetical protein EDB81DRAFT_332436 [Dactylonectria macrodidyma]|uniref:Uncharacterized protein n=1 Tax=Dactylonectria macrodidyma TaxID=307937 RepID=A0A9P9FFN4_9HYPO|nr:hypothetical protein EDB81DRAFT_332436 [Dactylonectria macrodidyma]